MPHTLQSFFDVFLPGEAPANPSACFFPQGLAPQGPPSPPPRRFGLAKVHPRPGGTTLSNGERPKERRAKRGGGPERRRGEFTRSGREGALCYAKGTAGQGAPPWDDSVFFSFCQPFALYRFADSLNSANVITLVLWARVDSTSVTLAYLSAMSVLGGHHDREPHRHLSPLQQTDHVLLQPRLHLHVEPTASLQELHYLPPEARPLVCLRHADLCLRPIIQNEVTWRHLTLQRTVRHSSPLREEHSWTPGDS